MTLSDPIVFYASCYIISYDMILYDAMIIPGIDWFLGVFHAMMFYYLLPFRRELSDVLRAIRHCMVSDMITTRYPVHDMICHDMI